MWTGRPRLAGTSFLVFGLGLLLSAEGWAAPSLVINEVMASNSRTLADPQGDFDDWIELYNPGEILVNVGGMYLTDDPQVPRKWRIPTGLRQATAVPARGFLVIWTDGDTEAAGLHASFRLDVDGDDICLFDADGKTEIDRLSFEKQTTDVSYGRYPDGSATLRFSGVPTPGQPNNEGYVDEVAPLQFSHERGFYDSPIDVTIATPTEGARILYTLDGYAPNEPRATAPAPVSRGRRDGGAAAPAVPQTQTSVYTGPIRINRTTCLRVVAEKPGWKPTPVSTHTYLFDLRAEFKTLPVVSLAGGATTVFYEPNGVMAIVGGDYGSGVWAGTSPDNYNNMLNHELERPVSVEWFSLGQDDGFGLNCGLRVHGSSYMRPRYVRQEGLWSGNGKISLRLYFRGEYGQSRLEYPLIPASEIERFATVVLRAGHNDRTNPFIQDELLRRLHWDMGQAAALGTFANLFINGEYKGYYNPTEHVKEESCQEWFGSDKPWDVMTMSGIRDGDEISFNAMVMYARSHNLADPANYAELCRKLDVVSFIDYLIIRLWPNDWDWPQNNWSAACERSPAGRWKFFVWDAEGTFRPSDVGLDRFNELDTQGNANGYLYQALKASPEFRRLFGDRVHKHFYHGGALTEANIRKRFNELREELRSVIPSMNSYIIDTWTPSRLPLFLGACARVGMYTFAGPGFAVNGTPQQGGRVAPGDRLSMLAADGRGMIFYTLDGTDPAQSDQPLGPNVAMLASRDAAKRILIPTGPLAGDWRSPRSFDDSTWQTSSGAPGGVGFGRGSGFEPYISANVGASMYNINSSCYLRIPFTFDGDKGGLNSMALGVQYDDGFVAYLNGNEIARRNFAGDPAWNSAATTSRDNAAAVVAEVIDVTDQIGWLRAGENVLAIQGLNVAANNSDFLIVAELTAGWEQVGSDPTGPQAYAAPVPLTRTTLVKARVRSPNAWSALSEAVFAVGPVREGLRISEIMYRPADTGQPDDPNAEYVELTNIGTDVLDLNLVQFTRGVRFTFPAVQLAPQAFCLVVKDPAAFEARHGPGLPVVGQYEGSLSDGGEELELRDAAGAIIHGFAYRDNWFRSTDGMGFSLTIRYPASTPVSAWGTPTAWRPSVAPGGSPGADDSGTIPGADAVVINELLASPLDGGRDWVELYNTTDRSLDLGGWFLSDDADRLTRYRIAQGTSIPPHGYFVLTEDWHFANLRDPGCLDPFGLNRDGETVYLSSGAGGSITGYREQAKFGPSEPGVTLGRHTDGVGGVQFVPLREATPGAGNAGPATGPVVITEILYHASGPGDVEFIELQNVSDADVVLYDVARSTPWRVTGSRDIEVLFPANPPVVLAPRAYVLLVKDRAQFESHFGVFPSLLVLEWGIGSLADAGGTIELSRPGDLNGQMRLWIAVDRVTYSDGSHPADFPAGLDPWPLSADGQGQSLTRLGPDRWGDDPVNWQAAEPSPGAARQRPTR
jgi:hypothetical protein